MWNALDRLLENAVEQNLFPGCAVAAGQRGKALYTKVCGRLVRDGERRASHSTRYDVGALTQVLVTTPLCMIAVERGLLEPEDTIDRFLPDVPADKQGITIAQLLTQTSGLSPHFLLQEEARSDRDALGALLRHPLAGPVGGKVSDSGMGFLLLGFLLEKVFAMPLDEAAKRFVTAPLGMNHTGYLPSGDDVAPTAFQDENGDLQPGVPLDGNARFLHGVAGHAGLFTNLEDLTRFASMLSLNGVAEGETFLSQRSVHLASTERTRGMNAARGYGFHIAKRQNPFLGALWPGEGYGLRDAASGCAVALSPQDGFFTVLLTNGAFTPARRAEAERFLRLALNASYAAFQHDLGRA